VVDWHSILTEYGVSVGDTSEFNTHCPFHKDARESCSINMDKQVWICHAGCGQGHLASFLQKISGHSWQEINELVEEQKWDLDFNLFDGIVIEEDYPTSLIAEMDSLVELPDSHWIFKREFDRDSLEKWGCKSNNYNDLVIPVKNKSSELLGWISRRVQATPKYLFSRGFKKSKSLFGIEHFRNRNVDVLFLVEGALDAIWLDQHGYTSAAILGATVSKSQADLISSLNPSELVLCLDNDEAGRKGIAKATLDMNERFMISYINLPDGYKDVQDIRSSTQLNKVLQNRNLW